MPTWSQLLQHYYQHLEPVPLPVGISWLHPQQEPAVQQTVQRFCDLFFNDTQPRTLMLGINPGRFGAGVTGVNFTAPRQLTNPCGIAHPFGNQSELSAEFIYDMIGAYGGPQTFYRDVFIGSVCPLGFVKGGKNLNYYDEPGLPQAVTPFILHSMHTLAGFPLRRSCCICIGGERNYRHLSGWNDTQQWFDWVVAVPHPRFIMQYRRRQKEAYIDTYLQALAAV